MRRTFLLSVCLLAAVFATAQRLPEIASPDNYQLVFAPNFTKDNFAGLETIHVRVTKSTTQIVLNSADIDIQEAIITSRRADADSRSKFAEGSADGDADCRQAAAARCRGNQDSVHWYFE